MGESRMDATRYMITDYGFEAKRFCELFRLSYFRWNNNAEQAIPSAKWRSS
jgi:hypothetical protein